MPAGMEPLSVKIYNYLHYGSSETVAAFCLLQVMVCMLMMGILYAGTQAHHKRIS
jgi:iron(III) transport system permease protein